MQLFGLLIIFILAAGIAAALLYLSQRLNQQQQDPTADLILDLLPQTQCAQCSYPGCAPYAAAVAQGEAHNKCPPGGDALIAQLSELLNRETLPLEQASSSSTSQVEAAPVPLIALIREAECIGCAKCIPACPVDAIVGASQMMHTVIVQDCTGCELCIAPCPVDCIDLLPRAEFV